MPNFIFKFELSPILDSKAEITQKNKATNEIPFLYQSLYNTL